MKKVMKMFLVFIMALGIISTQNVFALSNIPKVTKVTASNISELIDAVGLANSSGGNIEILVKKGVYDLSYLYELKGYNCFWIGVPNVTIRGEGCMNDVIIKGDAMSADAHIQSIFNVAGTDFTCENMTLKDVGRHAIQIHGENNVDNVVIKNVHFVDTYQQMLKISSDANPSSSGTFSDNGNIENCLFEYSSGKVPFYYTNAIDGHHCKNWTIKNNTVKNIVNPDGDLTEPAIHFWNGSDGITIENNIIRNCERGIYLGMGQDTICQGTIINNVVYTVRDVSIGIENAPGTIIKNNTCHTENYPNSIEYRWPGTTGTHIRNNEVTGLITSRDGATASVLSGNINLPQR